MIIEWTDIEKDVPGLGRVNRGDVRRVSKALGRALVGQGQAIEVKEKGQRQKNKG